MVSVIKSNIQSRLRGKTCKKNMLPVNMNLSAMLLRIGRGVNIPSLSKTSLVVRSLCAAACLTSRTVLDSVTTSAMAADTMPQAASENFTDNESFRLYTLAAL